MTGYLETTFETVEERAAQHWRVLNYQAKGLPHNQPGQMFQYPSIDQVHLRRLTCWFVSSAQHGRKTDMPLLFRECILVGA